MTHSLKSALLVAALSAPLMAGLAPAAFGAESADQVAPTQTTLLTIKSDRAVHSPTAQSILAAIAAEQNG